MADNTQSHLKSIYTCNTHPPGINKARVIEDFFQNDEETWGYLINLIDGTSLNHNITYIHNQILDQNIYETREAFHKTKSPVTNIGGYRLAHYLYNGHSAIDQFTEKNLTTDEELAAALEVTWPKVFDFYEQILDEVVNVKKDLITHEASQVDMDIVPRLKKEFLDFKKNKYDPKKIYRRFPKTNESKNQNQAYDYKVVYVKKAHQKEYEGSEKDKEKQGIKQNHSKDTETLPRIEQKKKTQKNGSNYEHKNTNEQHFNETNQKKIGSMNLDNVESQSNHQAFHSATNNQVKPTLIEKAEPVPCCQKCNIFQILMLS